jgi:hypothetical protein
MLKRVPRLKLLQHQASIEGVLSLEKLDSFPELLNFLHQLAKLANIID